MKKAKFTALCLLLVSALLLSSCQLALDEQEYTRDKLAGLNPKIPENYFPGDDDTKAPVSTWRGHATLLFTNWLNYFVYQTTPYDIMKIKEIK